MTTNYIDPDATKPVDLGPCRCPGTPHGRDTANVVVQFGYGDRGVIRQAFRASGFEAFNLMAILRGVKSWSLTLPDGKPRPIDAEQLERLDEGTVNALMGPGSALDKAFDEDPLPKASSARSRGGSRASASSTPTTPTPTSSTTPS